jgi:hypothetical protein
VNCTFRGIPGSFGLVDSEKCVIRCKFEASGVPEFEIVQFVVNLNISLYSVLRIVSLCGLVVRVPGYRSRGPGLEVVSLERGPLSLVRITEELYRGYSGSGLENRN